MGVIVLGQVIYPYVKEPQIAELLFLTAIAGSALSSYFQLTISNKRHKVVYEHSTGFTHSTKILMREHHIAWLTVNLAENQPQPIDAIGFWRRY